MKRVVLILLLIGPFLGMAQSTYTLQGKLDGLPNQKIYLLSFYGEKNALIDSAQTNDMGNFSFTMPATLAPGLYRTSWGKETYVDLVFNRENIRFRTNAGNASDSLVIIESVENKIFYDFMMADRVSQTKLELLQPIVDYYPDQDVFYFNAIANYEQVQRRQEFILDSLKRGFPDSYAVKILSHYSTPFLPASLSHNSRLVFLKQHYFDLVDFTDTSLLRSNAWPNKAISYLALYSSNRLSQKQLEGEFIKAVTVMLSNAGENPEIFKFLLDYLVSGFDKYHFEDVIAYLAENFQDPFSCEDQEKKSELQKKLDTFKKIAIGQPAPEFEIPDTKGLPVKLSGIDAEYTLLIFWSSECGHCTQMLPKAKALYEAQSPKRYEVVAISIDTSRSEWMQVVNEEKLNWINASELKGFDGKSADLYNIYATPTMFLLDRDKKIVSKPISYRELEVALRQQGLL
ncbi:MAG: redoxin domain-containing protein [Bacteroidales bacterium]|nr:redoxin domain-containing protein [Bacteroidales bacterium]